MTRNSAVEGAPTNPPPVEAELRISPELARELYDLLANHPPYAADTTFAAIWTWLSLKDAALEKLAKVRNSQ